MRAMDLGYDVLLEKPIAQSPGEVLRLLEHAEKLGRKVLVCHVLRYTSFYTKVKEIVDSGVLGELVTVDAREGVEPWHQGHSFVRGHWGVTGKCTPMIVAKSCHDMDILSWLVGKPCKRVSSFGSLNYFTAANAPEGAPLRCTDGCPAGDRCFYNALRYMDRQKTWLPYIMDGAETASNEEIHAWLAGSPWGRCVYRCDNDAVDRQVVNLEFQGAVTATFTMTAFDSGRSLVICGTKGKLIAGSLLRDGHDVLVEMHTGDKLAYNISYDSVGYGGHGGGDGGIVGALDVELAKPAREMRSGLWASVESHLMAYAAEESRVTGCTVDLSAYRAAQSAG